MAAESLPWSSSPETLTLRYPVGGAEGSGASRGRQGYRFQLYAETTVPPAHLFSLPLPIRDTCPTPFSFFLPISIHLFSIGRRRARHNRKQLWKLNVSSWKGEVPFVVAIWFIFKAIGWMRINANRFDRYREKMFM